MFNTVTDEHINSLIERSRKEVTTIGKKTTLVHLRLPNGFEITETSACVSPDNYSEDVGYSICLEKIKTRLWAFEGYRLQQVLYDEQRTADTQVYAPTPLEQTELDLAQRYAEAEKFWNAFGDRVKHLGEKADSDEADLDHGEEVELANLSMKMAKLLGFEQ